MSQVDAMDLMGEGFGGGLSLRARKDTNVECHRGNEPE